MKKLILFICLIGLSNSLLISQNAQVTLEEIWASGKFSADYVWGQRSMNDGEHYTTSEDGKILKNAYRTGEQVLSLIHI